MAQAPQVLELEPTPAIHERHDVIDLSHGFAAARRFTRRVARSAGLTPSP
jgi:hypothetical protein